MAPFHALHFLSVIWKRRLRPIDDTLEVMPQWCCVLLVLVLRHVLFDVPLRLPIDCRFEIILPDRAALEVVACDPVGGATRFAEISLGISRPRASVHGVAQFLIG